jgi:hypothetical protein
VLGLDLGQAADYTAQHFNVPKPVEEPYHPRLHERVGGSLGSNTPGSSWPEDDWFKGQSEEPRSLWGRIFRR